MTGLDEQRPSRRLWIFAAVTALADRLAARTLELVDIPSQSGSEAAIRERLLELVPSGFRTEFAGDEA